MASAVLKPAAALRYLRELSPYVSSAALHDRSGVRLAGDFEVVDGADVLTVCHGEGTLQATLDSRVAANAALTALAHADALAALRATEPAT
jgi:hypothetical protein